MLRKGFFVFRGLCYFARVYIYIYLSIYLYIYLFINMISNPWDDHPKCRFEIRLRDAALRGFYCRSGAKSPLLQKHCILKTENIWKHVLNVVFGRTPTLTYISCVYHIHTYTVYTSLERFACAVPFGPSQHIFLRPPAALERAHRRCLLPPKWWCSVSPGPDSSGTSGWHHGTLTNKPMKTLTALAQVAPAKCTVDISWLQLWPRVILAIPSQKAIAGIELFGVKLLTELQHSLCIAM